MQLPSSTSYHATLTENNKTHKNPGSGEGQMLCHMGWKDMTESNETLAPKRASITRVLAVPVFCLLCLNSAPGAASCRRFFDCTLVLHPLPELRDQPNSLLNLNAIRMNHIYWAFFARTALPCSPDADEEAIVEAVRLAALTDAIGYSSTYCQRCPPIFLRTLGARNRFP